MQPLEIDSAVFCDGAHYTIISRENSSILTCPVGSGAGGYTLNRVEVRDIDREAGRLTGHAACIAVDVPTWCRIAGDPLDAVADALADLLDETPSRFELEQLAAASPLLKANTPGIPVFPRGIAPAANSYTLAGCCRAALVRGLSSPELYATALMAAETAISTARQFGVKVPEAIGTSEGLFSVTIGLGGTDTAEIGVNCVDARSDGGVLIEGAAYPIADGGRERAFFGFVDTAEDSRDYMREVPDGADGVKRLADAALPHRAPRCRPTRPTPASWRASPPSRESAPARSPTRARRPAAPRGQLVRANRTGRPTGAGPRSRDGASRSGTCVHTAAPRPYHQGNIHIAAAFPRRIPLRSCAMEHIVLEYDENTRTALVVATSGGHEPVLSGHASPYIVADGYDFESRSWGAGHYFTDIAQAKIDYERSCRHPYPLAEGKLRGDEFCTIRWCRDDVAEAFSDFLSYPVPATEKNIDAAIGQLMAHDGFQDRSIEDGWETISAIIDEDALDLGISTKQGADFYRDAFGLSSFTEAVVWPSSDRDAAFVMTSAVDGEDGDLAVYKIDAGLIGDDEITVDDIERLGGKRELCVYKHGLDGIEAIRAFANRVAVDRFDERFGVNNLYGELPDLAPTLRKVTEDARTAAQKPLDPQAIAAAALSAAEGGAKGAVELVGNKR